MGAPVAEEVAAAPGWRTVDCISDLHLHAQEPANFAAWRAYMAETPADAVFILGDLFEAWVGDDAAREPGFAADCATVLREAARSRALFFLHGNRDFLVGAELVEGAGGRLLADPAVLGFGGRRWLLTHGDALCLDDAGYLAFRAKVRAPAWQREFLARPLAERLAIARDLRAQSEAIKQGGQTTYGDIDAVEALAWMRAARADAMIHGHTHRPADHELDGGLRRFVLSDWDATASPPRREALRLAADGSVRRVPLA